jgi:hypothetical protein
VTRPIGSRRRFAALAHAGAAAAAAWACALVCALGPAPAGAGTTGKIAGRVVDAKGAPLLSVSVAVPALRIGAETDADGRFTILNVAPGTYDVRANLLGYGPVLTTGLVVSADLTTRLDLVLKESAVQLKEIVVKSTRPVVDVGKTNSLQSVTAKEISKLPVQNLDDVVNLQAGVVDGHFRGGRIGEVQYQVDGVSVNNLYDNKTSLNLDRSLLEEVQVISGTFDAEYGQAQSGVVNAVLKRGTRQFEGRAEVFTGGYVFPGEASTRHLDWTFRPSQIENFQASLSGPTPLKSTLFLLNAQRFVSNDFAYGTRLFEPTDRSDFENLQLKPTGDGRTVPLGVTREWSGVGKVSTRLIPNVELSYQAIVNVIDGQRDDWAFNLLPDGRTQQHTFSIVHGIDWNHTLSKKSFYTASIRQNYFDYHDWAYANLYDPRYDSAGVLTNIPNLFDNAWLQGVDFSRFVQNTNTLLVKSSYVRQATERSQLKFGQEFQLPRVYFGAPGSLAYVTDPSTGKLTLLRYIDRPDIGYPGAHLYLPVLAAAFAQDQLEWNDMTMRLGVRFDYFNARSSLPGDLANPANSIAGAPAPGPRPTTAKWSVSPRLGVSWPTGPKSAAHFAYGHFAQFPAIGDIFRNADYSVLKDLQADPTSEAAKGVLGNPDIKPERTVQYEGGYKMAVSDNVGADLTVFYKDIRDLLGVEFIQTYNGAEYARLTNIDFGSVLGFTAAFTVRESGPFGMSVDYTWQKAEGNASDPRETETRAAAGEDPRPRQVPFNWDQRHTLNLTMSWARDDAYNVAAIVRAGSGQPYTPVLDTGFGNGLEDNSGRKPGFVYLDLRGEKDLHWGRAPLSVFARVFNVFDQRFVNGPVFATTGSPYYSRFSTDQPIIDDPTRYFTPRRIEVGLTLASPRHGEKP